MEVEVLEKEISSYNEEISKIESLIAEHNKNIENLNEKISEIKVIFTLKVKPIYQFYYFDY